MSHWLQPNVVSLVDRFCEAGHPVWAETAGALDIRLVDIRASRIVDIKTPASGEVARNRWDNLDALMPHNQIKFS